jgi:hypothetical protein
MFRETLTVVTTLEVQSPVPLDYRKATDRLRKLQLMQQQQQTDNNNKEIKTEKHKTRRRKHTRQARNTIRQCNVYNSAYCTIHKSTNSKTTCENENLAN